MRGWMGIGLLTLLGARQFGTFIENRGQTYAEARLEARWGPHHVYLIPEGIAILFVDGKVLEKAHFDRWPEKPQPVMAHFVRIRWVGGQAVEPEGLEPETTRYNFYLGPWRGTEARGFRSVRYRGIYEGVDLFIRLTPQGLKWDWEVRDPQALSRIQLSYEGLPLSVSDNQLTLHTVIGDFVEALPLVYEKASRRPLPARYRYRDNLISYEVSTSPAEKVIIDPIVIFSTYSGSYSDNWGFTATYDLQGNAFAGGNVNDGVWQWNPWGIYFPVTPGVVQGFFGGGVSHSSNAPIFWSTDIALWKVNPTGTTRLWATYLGGSDNEQPHSLVTDPAGNLYLLGATRSLNFPTTPGAYQPQSGGNIDIVVAAISSNGATLLGSTYLGGSGEDGLNSRNFPLYYFYADDGRGEIVLSDTACYIISSSRSTNFPVTPNTIQNQRRGGMDAVICKLSLDLTQLYASTYLGGTNADAGYSIKVGLFGTVYVCGGTNSTNFPTTPGSYQPNFQGGRADGWLTVLGSNLDSILVSTYWGTSAYDQVFMIDLDRQGFLWGAGHTEGTLTPTPGTYGFTGRKQFVFSMNSDLSQVTRLSPWGSAGRATPNITISAFAADRCGYLYVSGWGGLDVGNGPVGSTIGLPTTANANQTSTDGADFYVIAFANNLSSVAYASFWGGPLAEEHVDGGTSRFDNRGLIYQSVCGGCGGLSDFPTTPGAVSNANNSQNCNNALFKIDFELGDPVVAASALVPGSGCAPLTVNIQNLSNNAVSYFWNFGNGQTSTVASPPPVTYTQPGTYIVTLVAINLATCNQRDTLRRVITVRARPSAAFSFRGGCGLRGDFLALDSTALDYLWDFGDGNTGQGRSIAHTYAAAGTYTVRLIVRSGPCADTLTQPVVIQPSAVQADFSWVGDTCNGRFSFQNLSRNASSFVWIFVPGDTSRSFSPSYQFPSGGMYPVTLIAYDSLGCTDTVRKNVSVSQAVRAAWDQSIDYCNLTINLRDRSVGAGHWRWFLGDGTQLTTPNVTHTYASPGTYVITLIALSPDSLCADTLRDTVTISPYSEAIAIIRIDTCASVVKLVSQSTFANTVLWLVQGQPIGNTDTLSWQAPGPGTYTYQLITNPQGSPVCRDTTTGVFQVPERRGLDSVSYEADVCAGWIRFSVPLQASQVLFVQAEGSTYPPGTVNWTLPLRNPYAYEGLVGYRDSEGCLDTLRYRLLSDEALERALFIPNVFTPNGDGVNDLFRIVGSVECLLEMSIYDRWGNLLYTTRTAPFAWDGRVKQGEPANEGTYVYLLRFEKYVRAGTVTLVR
jgi:gliding motility-associated-like protein